VECHDGRENLPALLSEGFGLELRGWKGRQGTAVLSRPRTEQFYRAAAEWAAQAGILRLYSLRLDGRAIAFACQIEQRGVMYGVKKAYDEEFREYGPGLLLVSRLLADACRRPEVRLFEWQGQDEPHKLEFASGVRRQLHLQLFSRGVAGGVERGLAAAVSVANAEARRRLSRERRQQIRRVLHRVSAAVPSSIPARRADGRA
jgi:CelD/BcsL family acetyltransferase involved in cellulose biosynthesis